MAALCSINEDMPSAPIETINEVVSRYIACEREDEDEEHNSQGDEVA